MNNDQVLTRALGHAVNSLNYDAMALLINAGASVNAIGSDGIRNMIYEYNRALAHEKGAPVQAREFLTEYREKCCLVLGELIIHGAIPKNNEEKKNILKIFEEREGSDEFKEVVKLKLEANSAIPPKKPPRTFAYKPTNTKSMYAEVNNMIPPKKPPRTFEHEPENTGYDALPSKEPIYAEMYDSRVSDSLKEMNTSKESIYAEVYDSYKTSTENLSLEDSGYSSISEGSIYCTVDDLLEQKKAASLEQKEPEQLSEPIYAKVDLFKKRAERKAKDIKANSGTYHGLVQDKVSQWQERMKPDEQNSSRLINQQHTSNRKVETRAGFSVKEIKQKYESKNSGYDSGYESDTKVEQLRVEPRTPNSKVNSVNIECGIETGICVMK
ncbi:MAG: hypothetical protein ACR5K9_00890 [Wolbachia sp.]